MKVKRIGALSLARISGVLYAMIGLLIGIGVALVSLLGSAFGREFSNAGPSFLLPLLGIGAVIALPIFYGVLGFLGGLLMAGLYNLVAGMTGGVEIELQQ